MGCVKSKANCTQIPSLGMYFRTLDNYFTSKWIGNLRSALYQTVKERKSLEDDWGQSAGENILPQEEKSKNESLNDKVQNFYS